jgi:carnitine O-acetyltransferase
MDSVTTKITAAESQGNTVVRPNVSPEQPSSEAVKVHTPKEKGLTFANQDSLPKLPIPDLEDTCRRHLEALSPLQTIREHEETKAAVKDFLKTDGPILQEKLRTYASSKTSYIEQFWYDSYLNFDNRKCSLFVLRSYMADIKKLSSSISTHSSCWRMTQPLLGTIRSPVRPR